MAKLAEIWVHPIKALDPMRCNQVVINEVGGLTGDRMFGIVDSQGDYVNGKRTSRVHKIRVDYQKAGKRVTFSPDDSGPISFDLDTDGDRIAEWLSGLLDIDVHLERGRGGELTDSAVYVDRSRTGPTILSEATIQEVASWFDGITPESMKRRFRPNLIIQDVPAFWEDRLVADDSCYVCIGDVQLDGVTSVPRCVVPTRNPVTGVADDGFRETFIKNRKSTLPSWLDESSIDGLFSLSVVTRIPSSFSGRELTVGEDVRLLQSVNST